MTFPLAPPSGFSEMFTSAHFSYLKSWLNPCELLQMKPVQNPPSFLTCPRMRHYNERLDIKAEKLLENYWPEENLKIITWRRQKDYTQVDTLSSLTFLLDKHLLSCLPPKRSRYTLNSWSNKSKADFLNKPLVLFNLGMQSLSLTHTHKVLKVDTGIFKKFFTIWRNENKRCS